MPKVSVIIPVYGVEKYIERCVTSLFEQTLDNIEFIFIDDCSPDCSINILNQVVDMYRNLLDEKKHILRIESMLTNSGQAVVRKRGIQLATGDFVIHCDSDDWVNTDMYRLLYEKAINDDADVVVCDFNNTDGCSNFQSVKGFYSNTACQFFYDMMYHKTSWSLWNKLVKRDIYASLVSYPKCPMGEDMVLMTQIILKSKKISYVAESLYNYFSNPNSIMNTQTEEQCMNKYFQLKQNTDLLLPILKSALAKDCYQKIERVLTYNTTLTLFPCINKRQFFVLWRQEMQPCYRMLFDRQVKVIFKIMYILVVLKIYPLYKSFKNA